MNSNFRDEVLPLVIHEVDRLSLHLPAWYDKEQIMLDTLVSQLGDVTLDQVYDTQKLTAESTATRITELIIEQHGMMKLSPSLSSQELKQNIAFWTQHLSRDPQVQLRPWRPESDKYLGIKPKIHIPLDSMKAKMGFYMADLAENYNLSQLFSHAKLDILLWKQYILNLEALSLQFKDTKETFHHGLEDSNLIIISNHATWANLPFLAFCIQHFWGVPKENIHTMVGPAIMTSYFELAGIQRFSSVIPTWPETNRANTGYQGLGNVQKNALRQVLSIMNKSIGNTQVTIIAPSATKDISDGNGMLSLAKPSNTTQKLLQTIVDRGSKIMPIGVEDTGIIGISGKPQEGKVRVGIGSVSKDVTVSLNQLPGLVLGAQGTSIAKWEP